jgi:DNA-binding HxlR family transcriptional regulator
MSGYGQFCPVAKGAEVFAERWTPLILRELMCGSHHFNQLQRGVPRMSHSLLAQRLRSLERAGIVERRPAPTGRGWKYHLTPAGEELAQVVERLGAWGQRWAVDQLEPDDLDPALLLWAIHRDMHVDLLPERRVVVQFDFPDRPKERVWLILKRPEVEVCIKDYGLDVDLLVTADLLALTKVYLGRLELLDAIKVGLVELDGPLALRRAFPSWIGVSAFARYGRPQPRSEMPGAGIEVTDRGRLAR